MIRVQKTDAIHVLEDKARSTKNLSGFMEETRKKVKRPRYNSIENRNWHDLQPREVNKARKTEVKYKTLVSKRGFRNLHCFLYLNDPNAISFGLFGREFSCFSKTCIPCKSANWGKLDEETGTLVPACENPACGPWEYMEFIEQDPNPRPKKRQKIEIKISPAPKKERQTSNQKGKKRKIEEVKKNSKRKKIVKETYCNICKISLRSNFKRHCASKMHQNNVNAQRL